MAERNESETSDKTVAKGTIRAIQGFSVQPFLLIVTVAGVALTILGGQTPTDDLGSRVLGGIIILVGILLCSVVPAFIWLIVRCARIIDENNAERFRRLHESDGNTGE